MKKNILTSALAVTLLIAMSAFTTLKDKKVVIKNSTISWVGKKVTGQHSGNISLKEGFLMMKGKELRGGEFVIDMTSINVTDLSGDSKGKLEGHLKSDDFFGVANHPTATLKFTGFSGEDGMYTVIGDLTIKGKTNPVRFDLKIDSNKATTSFKVDRTKYDIKYGSGSFFDNLGDKAINDEFELNVSLEF
ncbi:YceI family protein [Spongiivirga sp. MCCC 1A20706]|uniref:YceI family protein n=1 Tax=Spongiivirga sp. MCCC 1A20706 TaxID=3160963 RepID=UPI003977925E